MAADQPLQDNIAIAFLVESSLEVAQEWRRRILGYFAALMKRLLECHPNSKQAKMAFVCYGPGDHAPSPILSKRYFTDQQSFFVELASPDVSPLGVGMTSSGGTRGMAALDGFVAVLELFDILHNVSNLPSTTTLHLIHVAASSPDSSLRPLWNEQPTLDGVTWETLPDEIKKRNVNLTSINLKHGLTHFSKLSSSVLTEGSSPWFTVHSPHILYLAAFPTPPQTKVTPTKRSVEPAVDRVMEKRPRLQPNTESPKPAPKPTTPQFPPNVPSQQPPQPPSRPVVPPVPSQGPPQGPTNLLAALASNRITPQQFMEKMKAAETELKIMKQQILTAQGTGNKELEETLSKNFAQKSAAFTTIARNYRLLQLAKAQGNNMMQNPGYSQQPLATASLPSTSSAPSMSQEVPPNPPQIQHIRSMSDANFPMNPANNPPLMANPNIASQMQKMMEQQQRVRPPHAPMGQVVGPNMMNNVPSTGLPNRLNPGNMPNQPQQQPDPHQQSTKGKMVWKGALRWSGTGHMGDKKEMQTFVLAVHTNDNRCHAETWPPEMSLAPVLAASEGELTEWMRRHLGQVAIVSLVAPSGNTANGRGNEANFASLLTLLIEKKVYATAAWTTPSGGQSKNALIFPMAGKLMGAIFPLSGIPPDLPTGNGTSDMHRFMKHLQTLAPEARAAWMSKFSQARGGILSPPQHQPSHSQDHNNAPPFPPALLMQQQNMMHMMNAQAQAQNGGMMNVNNQQPFPTSLPRPGMNNNPISNNVSPAMMQSFVQRNDGGTNLNPRG